MAIGTSFKPYRKLPIELRYKIWEDAANERVKHAGPIYVEVRVRPYKNPERRIRWEFSLRSRDKYQYTCPDERTVYETRFANCSLRDNLGIIIFDPASSEIIVDHATLFTLFKWMVPWKSGIHSLDPSWGPGLGPEIENRRIRGLELIQQLQITKADSRGQSFLTHRRFVNRYSITVEGIRLLRKHIFSAALQTVKVVKFLHPEAKAPYESDVRELVMREFASLAHVLPWETDILDKYEAQFRADIVTFWSEVEKTNQNHLLDEQRRENEEEAPVPQPAPTPVGNGGQGEDEDADARCAPS